MKDSYKDPIIYMFGGNLYVSWPNVRKAVKAVAYNEETKTWSRSHPLYVAVYGTGGTGEEGDASPQDESVLIQNGTLGTETIKHLKVLISVISDKQLLMPA